MKAKRKGRFAALLITAIMAVFLFSTAAFAETYEVNSDTALETAVASAQDGDVITLSGDIDLGSTILEITTGTSFTLDLGGYTLTGRVNVKNGTDVTIQNGTMTYYGGQPLNVYASGSISDPTALVLASSVQITNSAYGLCVFPTDIASGNGKGVNVTVNGNIQADSGVFVSGNIKSCSDAILLR